MSIRFVHTNIVARDWRALISFYRTVFDCVPIDPERDLSGDWLDKGTGIGGARISGQHLRLPGCGEDGPTLEIFQYEGEQTRPYAAPNTPGFAHIAFAVDDVAAAAEAVRQAGGTDIGQLVEKEFPGIGLLVFQYQADPEGNIIELQKWIRD
ncbi:MAG: VOC family protein [Proteobacteria bacterium]|nr:VOC family protein [Pseudomonadota bacterium]